MSNSASGSRTPQSLPYQEQMLMMEHLKAPLVAVLLIVGGALACHSGQGNPGVRVAVAGIGDSAEEQLAHSMLRAVQDSIRHGSSESEACHSLGRSPGLDKEVQDIFLGQTSENITSFNISEDGTVLSMVVADPHTGIRFGLIVYPEGGRCRTFDLGEFVN